MNLRDLVNISVGNLWRMKLRAFLTISGVVIAIAAFVSMLSFGAGNQRLVTEQFNQLGLFSTMYVYPPNNDNADDSLSGAVLDLVRLVFDVVAVLGVLAHASPVLSVTAANPTSACANAYRLPAVHVQTAPGDPPRCPKPTK